MARVGYKEPKAYKGFEQWWHAVQMSTKVYVYCFVTVLMLHLSIPAIYFIAYDRDFIDLFLKSVLRFEWKLAAIYGEYFWEAGLKIFKYAIPVWLLYPLLLRRFKKKAEKITQDEHLRGTKMVTDIELAKIIQKEIKEKGG
jgi:hypothetical protein